jgi:hypothetical protein
LENLGDDVESIHKSFTTENFSYYELEQHKPWFDEECLQLLNQWKHAKLQWMQNPSQMNEGNIYTI